MKEKYRKRCQMLGLRIALYRKERGFTQEEFAEKLGLSVSFVSQIEANNSKRIRGVSLSTLFNIADILSIPVFMLFIDDLALCQCNTSMQCFTQSEEENLC